MKVQSKSRLVGVFGFVIISLVAQDAFCKIKIRFRNPINNNKVTITPKDIIRIPAAVATGGLSEVEIARQKREAEKDAERKRAEAERQIREQERQAKIQAVQSQINAYEQELAQIKILDSETGSAVNRLLWIDAALENETRVRKEFIGSVRSLYSRYFGDPSEYSKVVRDLTASIIAAKTFEEVVSSNGFASQTKESVAQEVSVYLVELDERAKELVQESIAHASASDLTALRAATSSAKDLMQKFQGFVAGQSATLEAQLISLKEQLGQL